MKKLLNKTNNWLLSKRVLSEGVGVIIKLEIRVQWSQILQNDPPYN